MRLGCSTILYGGFDLPTALAGIQRAGYSAIELCSIPGMADHFPDDAPPATYAEIRQQIADHGLTIESLGASTNLLDPARRERFFRLMKVAARLGAPALTTGSGGVSDDSESYQQVVSTLKDLATLAAAEGVKISIKPHVRTAVYSTPTALRFARDVSTDWIGLNFDASHLWRANETPEDSLAQLGPHLATARIRDAVSRDATGPGPVDEQIPGNGAMNLAAIASGLASLPQISTTVLEIVGAKNLPLAEVQRVVQSSHDRLSSLFEPAK